MLRYVLSVLLLLPLLPAWAGDVAAARPAILVVGDSLSAGYGLRPGEGWVTLLENKLADEGYPYKVINASISGDTSAGGLARLPRALAVHKPRIVVLELGANDGLRGIDVATMKANLKTMIDLSRAAGAKLLLLGQRLPPNYGQAYTERFHQVYVDLAKSEQVPLLDFFLDGIATDDALLQADRLHPVAKAQSMLLANVWPKLEPLLKK